LALESDCGGGREKKLRKCVAERERRLGVPLVEEKEDGLGGVVGGERGVSRARAAVRLRRDSEARLGGGVGVGGGDEKSFGVRVAEEASGLGILGGVAGIGGAEGVEEFVPAVGEVGRDGFGVVRGEDLAEEFWRRMANSWRTGEGTGRSS
jgi:hypothetical protein